MITLMPRRLPPNLRAIKLRLMHPRKQKFKCPVCCYQGPFRDITPETGLRRHAECARCGSLERHRLQYLVMEKVFSGLDTKAMSMLHFAPEHFFKPIFSQRFGTYETADIDMPNVDHAVDLCALPFPDGVYDVVYASHVLEHIRDDRKAISEIRRVLAPGGIAVLPVPLVSGSTIEYPEPNPHEAMHVRAPGPDYFDRLRPFFASVDICSSADFPEESQLFVYEDRTTFPRPNHTFRTAMAGDRHVDMVPVCSA